MSTSAKITKRSECPNCSDRKLISIVYGYPTSLDMDRAHQREIAIGGCIVSGDDAAYRCGSCAAYVYKDGRFDLPVAWDYFDSLVMKDRDAGT